MVLALLYLTTFTDQYGMRAWKGVDWGVMGLRYSVTLLVSFIVHRPALVRRDVDMLWFPLLMDV